MLTNELIGPDLSYWVARANLSGSRHEADVLRRDYGLADHDDPTDAPSKRAFVESKFGPVLPERSKWH
jgi:hypothetical protein